MRVSAGSNENTRWCSTPSPSLHADGFEHAAAFGIPDNIPVNLRSTQDLARRVNDERTFSVAPDPMLLLCDVSRNVYPLLKAFGSVFSV